MNSQVKPYPLPFLRSKKPYSAVENELQKQTQQRRMIE